MWPLRWPSCAPVRSLTGGGNEHGDKRHLACPHSRACELGMKKAKALQLNHRGKSSPSATTRTPRTAHECGRERVLHVTPRGGIKVKVTDEKPWLGSAEYARRYGDNEVRWVPYHHIFR